jgi:sugar lactone lactonase YvrE
MEVVDALPDPTSEYLGRSLVQRAPGGFRSSVNTAIQLADDSIVWSSMVMEDPPLPTDFAPLRTWLVGGASSLPASISVKSTGYLWIVDQQGSRIWHHSGAGGLSGSIDVVASFGGPGGVLLGGIDVAPDDVFWWFYNAGSVSPNNRLYAHLADGTASSNFAVSSVIMAPNWQTGEFHAVALNSTRTVIYTTNPYQANSVERFSNGGTYLSTIGGGTSMAYPSGVCLDPAGNIWIADSGQHWVRKYDGTTFGQLFQIGPGLPGAADGQFNGPRGLHADASNRLFVCDTGNNRIQVFDLSGNFLAKFGSAGTGGDQFNTPYDVTVFGTAPTAVISIADRNNHRIVQWQG